MKTIYLLCLSFLILVSCKNDDENSAGLIDTWTLEESLADPGDGSGIFVPVNSNVVLSIFDDGTYLINGTLCNLSIESGPETRGSYDIEEMVFRPTDCPADGGPALLEYSFEQTSDELIIHFICIEGCSLKFKRAS